MACSHKDSCALFPVISLSSALKIWQTFYCDGKHETCLRYQRSLKGEKVPPNLLPNGKELDLIVEGGAVSRPATVPATPAVATTASASTPNRSVPAKPASAFAGTGTPTYSYYVRFRIKNMPELADKIVQEIRKSGISIDAMITKQAPQQNARCLIIITDQGPELDLYQAVLRIEAFEGVIAKVKCIPLEKLDALQAA